MNNFYYCSLRAISGIILSICCISLHAQTPKIQGQKAHMTPVQTPNSPLNRLPVQSAPAQPRQALPISQPAQIGTKDVAPGKILIKMKEGPSVSIVQKRLSMLALNSRPETFQTGVTHLDAVARQFRAIKMIRVFPNAGRMETKQHKYGLDRWYAIQVDNATEISTAVNSFKSVTEIETAQPAYVIKSIQSPIIKITGSPKSKPLDASTYVSPVNDPYYYLQWNYHNTGQEGGYTGADIDLEAAWKINAGKAECYCGCRR